MFRFLLLQSSIQADNSVPTRAARLLLKNSRKSAAGKRSSQTPPMSWKTSCNKIALELRDQYVLGYHSTNETKDGKWRKIRLKINPPKGVSNLSVRGKSGYYAETLNIKP